MLTRVKSRAASQSYGLSLSSHRWVERNNTRGRKAENVEFEAKSEVDVELKNPNVHVAPPNRRFRPQGQDAGSHMEGLPPQMSRPSSDLLQASQSDRAPPLTCGGPQTRGREEFRTQGFLGHSASVLHSASFISASTLL